MGSTVLVVAIVAVWVIVLLPMFLRSHDKRSELNSVDRFAGAMRVLSRRRRPGRYDLRPSHERAEAIERVFAPAAAARRATARVEAVAAARSARAAARRAAAPAAPRLAPRPVPRPVPRRVSPASGLSARAAARRRGLVVLLAVEVVFLLLALVVGGATWAAFGLVTILALAGLAQLRAMAIADRYRAAGVPRRTARVEVPREVEREPVRAPAPAYEEAPAPARQTARMPVPQARPVERPVAVGESSYGTPVARGAGKQIVFDAVSETPVVDKPRVRTTAAPARRVRAGVPDDFYERPVSPPAPERRAPLLDEVDTDPDTMTSGLEALDSILGRAANE